MWLKGNTPTAKHSKAMVWLQLPPEKGKGEVQCAFMEDSRAFMASNSPDPSSICTKNPLYFFPRISEEVFLDFF